MLKLFKLTNVSTSGWDTYDTAVVCARSEAEARLIHPSGMYDITEDGSLKYKDEDRMLPWSVSSDWAYPNELEVECIGIAGEDIKEGLIIASFNAG